MNRVFISYRSVDGKKDAARLAGDLGRLYGDDQVYFDKHDLRGGVSWREAIAAAIGEQPVVLLLITPALFGGVDAGGARCIDHPEDPIRNELLAARKAGAVLLPLLADGMAMPDVTSLPAELRFVAEAHALKLRTDDWTHDLARLQDDLAAHGVAPSKPAALPVPPVPPPQRPRRSWLAWAAAAVFGMAGVAYFAGELGSDDVPASERGLDALSGNWWLLHPAGQRIGVKLDVAAGASQLQTEPVPVVGDPAWAEYAERMQREHGVLIRNVVYRARGALQPGRLDMAVEVFTGDGAGPLDTGNISLVPTADPRRLDGAFWSNGSQASWPWQLQRR